MHKVISKIINDGMASIASVVAFVTAIVAFIRLIESDTGTVMTVLTLFTGTASTAACGYLAFARQPSQTAVGQQWWKFPRWRKPAFVGFVIMPILTAVAIGVPLLWPPSWSVVVVADFAGPDPLNTRLTETIISELRRRIRNPVRVKTLGRAISEQEGSEMARASAKKVGARILLWGWYGRTNEKAAVTYHVEFLNERYESIGPQKPLGRGGIDGTFITTVKSLDTFKTQQSLAERLTDEVERKLAMETHSIFKLDERHSIFKLDERVGYADQALDGRPDSIRTHETNLGNFIADAFRETHGADVALVRANEIRIGRIVGPGAITKLDVIQMLPFGNTIVKVQISGELLESVIENGLEPGTGGFLQVSGVKFTYDPDRPSGKRLVSAIVGEQPIEKSRTYTLAASLFFIGSQRGRFESTRYIVGPDEAPMDTRVLLNALHTKHTFPSVEGRIVPFKQ